MDAEKLGEEIWLLTVNEIAFAFGVQPETIRRWVAKGKFPEPFRLQRDGVLRWRAKDIQGFLTKRQRKTLPRTPRGFFRHGSDKT